MQLRGDAARDAEMGTWELFGHHKNIISLLICRPGLLRLAASGGEAPADGVGEAAAAAAADALPAPVAAASVFPAPMGSRQVRLFFCAWLMARGHAAVV